MLSAFSSSFSRAQSDASEHQQASTASSSSATPAMGAQVDGNGAGMGEQNASYQK